MQVIYEDNHIIIVNKQSGEIVQGDKTGDRPLSDMIKDYLKEKYHKPGAVFLGVVHRLDRPVSGVVVFAKTSKALTRLNKMFAEGEVHKTYWAISPLLPSPHRGGTPSASRTEDRRDARTTTDRSACRLLPEGRKNGQWQTLEHWLVRNEKQNKSYAYDHEVPKAKKAMLRYRMLTQGDHYALLEVQLMTGRHHQIRCQLAAIGCPIKGDLKYGARRSNPDGSISLLARRVEFVHPVSKEPICIEAPVPDDALWQSLAKNV